MNGTEELDIITKAKAILDEYESSIKFKVGFSENSVGQYLTAGQSEIGKMSREELAEAAICLSQYALYIQKEYNRNDALAKLSWSVINSMISKAVGGYKGYSYDERRSAAIMDNDVARELLKAKNHFELIVNDLNFMSTRIEKLSDKYSNMSYSRGQARNG